jgi:hypothetical protein
MPAHPSNIACLLPPQALPAIEFKPLFDDWVSHFNYTLTKVHEDQHQGKSCLVYSMGFM